MPVDVAPMVTAVALWVGSQLSRWEPVENGLVSCPDVQGVVQLGQAGDSLMTTSVSGRSRTVSTQLTFSGSCTSPAIYVWAFRRFLSADRLLWLMCNKLGRA